MYEYFQNDLSKSTKTIAKFLWVCKSRNAKINFTKRENCPYNSNYSKTLDNFIDKILKILLNFVMCRSRSDPRNANPATRDPNGWSLQPGNEMDRNLSKLRLIRCRSFSSSLVISIEDTKRLICSSIFWFPRGAKILSSNLGVGIVVFPTFSLMILNKMRLVNYIRNYRIYKLLDQSFRY